MLAVPMLPGDTYRNALKRGCRDECDNVQYTKHNRDLDATSEALVGEDAEVEEQDCYLGQGDRCQVEEFSVVEDL